MRKRNLPQTKTAKKSRRDRDPIPWRYTLLTLFCALFLVAGFFFAARQHFSSIDYGMKNSKLRKQLDELEGEKRRLILEKEIALSPAEIKKAAKKIGMTTMTASNIEVVGGNPKIAETIKTEKISTFKAAEKTPSEPKPAQTTANKADDKNIKVGKQGKSDKITSEPKKNSDGRDRIAVKTTK